MIPAMTFHNLDKSEWQAYFDNVSRHLHAAKVGIEVASLDLGQRIQAEWVTLYGLTYDRHSDVLEVAMENLDHLIQHPQQINVDDSPDGLQAVQVIDGDGNRQIIKLREPLGLPG